MAEMVPIFFVNTYDSKGRPFEDDGVAFDAKDYENEAAALAAAEEAYNWYVAHGARTKLIKVGDAGMQLVKPD